MNKAIPILATIFTLLLVLLACNPPVENPVPDQTPQQTRQRGELPERIGMYKAFQAGTVYVHVGHVQEMRQDAGAQVLASGMWRMSDRNGNSHDLETVTFGQSGTFDYDSNLLPYPEPGDELTHYGAKCEPQNCEWYEKCKTIPGTGNSLSTTVFQCRCSEAPLVFLCYEVFDSVGTTTSYHDVNCMMSFEVSTWVYNDWSCI